MKRAPCLIIAIVMAISAACNDNAAQSRSYALAVGGDARRGAVAIQTAGCGACHSIPGIAGAHGMVAAPLNWFARRTFIGGEVPNTPENLVRWIRAPRSLEPHTAMPSTNLSDQQARDVAAFLYTLR